MTMHVESACDREDPYGPEREFIRTALVRGASLDAEMEEILSAGVSEEFLPVVLWQVRCGGKRLRPVLTLLFAEVLGNPQPRAAAAAACGIELIHTCSLIFDDIMDHGAVRRNRPTVRAEFSDDIAILAGLQHREAATACALRTGAHAVAVERVYSDAIQRIIEGQRLDLLFEQGDWRRHGYFQRNRYRRVSLEDYFHMVRCKTAVLIAAACRSGVLVAGGGQDEQAAAEAYGENLGVAFQMLDDYLDVFADPRLGAFGKEPYKDIKERKLGNYVVLKACEALSAQDTSALLSLLRGPVSAGEQARVRACMALIEKAGVKESIRSDARRWTDRAKEAIAGRFTGRVAEELAMVADMLADRTF